MSCILQPRVRSDRDADRCQSVSATLCVRVRKLMQTTRGARSACICPSRSAKFARKARRRTRSKLQRRKISEVARGSAAHAGEAIAADIAIKLESIALGVFEVNTLCS